MKKFLALLLAAVMVLALTGCMSFGYDSAVVDPAADTVTDGTQAADGAQDQTMQQQTMAGSGLFTWFQLALAVYLLYCVVTGRGKLFDNEYTKCDYKKYRRNMRILSGVAGVILLATCILELTGVVEGGTTLGWILWGVGLAAIAGVLVYNVVMTDRKAMAEAQKNAQYSASRHPNDPLRAAFVFDDEDEQETEAAKPDEAAAASDEYKETEE